MQKMRFKTAIFALAISALWPASMAAGNHEDAVTAAVTQYMPGTTAMGKVYAKSVAANAKTKTVKVVLCDNAAYLPLDATSLKAFKADVENALAPDYNGYKVSIFVGDTPIEKLALFAPKKNIGPTERNRFITRSDKPAAPAGLDGANIAMWQSHGWYFEPKLNRWEWQRARIFQTVEDLYTQSYVMPFLMPMLENAGAYVMSPRERDTATLEIIADNDGGDNTKGSFSTIGDWSDAGKAAFAYTKAELHNGDHPFAEGSALKARLSGSDKADASASWSARFDKRGKYAVYVSYVSLPASATKAQYVVHAADGDHTFFINQKMGGGTWIYLGHFPFKASDKEQTVVELFNTGRNKKEYVTADAVKIGGGMGNVARIVKQPLDSIDYQYVLSGYPRFTEGARYWLQWAGAPDSVYTPTDYVNDYTDDYRSRGMWVNWLTGGSSMLPKEKGLGIPLDLSFAFHSDAGTTLNDSIIGTLGIYCTAGEKLGNGSSRMASRDLTQSIMDNIVGDIRAGFEPNWTRRQMWDKSYFEARVPAVPAMLLELLSHQNLADMSYGLDPTFRFTVSRAIYKGMLKFLANRDGRDYVVQPLPVHAFAIASTGADGYRLSWQATADSLEATATPTYYIIEERIDDGEFSPIARTADTAFELAVADKKIHSYRIIAANDGGTAFPSEVLCLYNAGKDAPTVEVVNGFTRISAPDRFDAGSIAGFYDEKDYGVPYIEDISYIGSQFEFRRNIPWMDDDAAGFGASHANYETAVIAGNTFDFVYTHARAIADARYSVVSSSVEAFCAASGTPKAVDLILGKQKETKPGRGAYGTRYKAFTPELQQRMAALASQGTSFFVSGAYVASDIWDNPYSTPERMEADKTFAKDVLGFCWRVDQASVTGEAYQVPCRFKAFNKGTYKFANTLGPDCYAVESPDSFYAADSKEGCTIMRYSENNLVAGTAVKKPGYRTVVIGFPFETIESAEARTHLMRQVLDFIY